MRVVVAIALLLLMACSPSRTARCQAVHDTLDPFSTVHILPGAPTPHYLTDPPTSGEHQPVNVRSYRGLREDPVPPQIQVALLESGEVVVQFRAPATALDVTPLATMTDVTVAPATALPAPVVATAWLWRLTCSSVSLPDVRHFISSHAGRGPQRAP